MIDLTINSSPWSTMVNNGHANWRSTDIRLEVERLTIDGRLVSTSRLVCSRLVLDWWSKPITQSRDLQDHNQSSSWICNHFGCHELRFYMLYMPINMHYVLLSKG
jgi:hypothetical protein